jgi:hypothetical protein
MAQEDYVIADQTGVSFLGDLNNTLEAIVTNNSGATEPTLMYPYQWWADTTAGILKQRNSANNAWINRSSLSSSIIPDFESTGIDDNATSTQLTIADTSATFASDIKSNGTVLVDESVIVREAVTDNGIGTSENVRSTLTITIPSHWNSYDIDATAVGWLDEIASAGSNSNITLRLRKEISGDIIARVISDNGTAPPDIRTPFSLYGFVEGGTASGDVSISFTSQIDGGSSNFGTKDVKFRMTAKRVS